MGRGAAGHAVEEWANGCDQSGKDEGGQRADALRSGRNEGKGDEQGGADAGQHRSG
jgi:hypothetical protein